MAAGDWLCRVNVEDRLVLKISAMMMEGHLSCRVTCHVGSPVM